MTARDTPHMRNEILGEASRWFVELNEHPEDEEARKAFDRWLRRSPEHLHAFLQISAHWEEGAPRPDAPVESVEDLIALAKADSNVVELAGSSPVQVGARKAVGAGGVNSLRANASGRTRRGLWFALAASVLVSLAATLTWNQFLRGTYSTDVGEQRSIALEDGSTVELNSRTRIRVKYSALERHVDLLEGQALFHVAKKDSQPFVVQSGNTLVRAVGTRFDVYRNKTGTVVTVVEGRVAVVPVSGKGGVGSAPVSDSSEAGRAPSTSSSPHPGGAAEAGPGLAARFLDAGQQLILNSDAAAVAAPALLEPAGVEAATAWTQRRLIFKGAPLSEVVEEFNRYSERPMIVNDAQIAAVPISGSFSSSDPTDLLRFLREVGGYEVRETPSAIEISRR